MTKMSLLMLELPPSVKGNGPTLRTIVEIANILYDAREDAPLSLAEVKRRMQAKQVRHSAVRASVDFLKQQGYLAEGSKGVMWAYNPHMAELLRDSVPLKGLL